MSTKRKPILCGLLGLGTVGSGVAELLESNRELIESRIGAGLVIKKALVRDTGRSRPNVPASIELTTRPDDILADPEISLVIELMGGYEPAREYILKAIAAGKHIVTANKAVLAKHWDEIFHAAHDKKVDVFIEASVGGGIPCIQAIGDGLAANKIKSLVAIINGTTNYMLTRMDEDGWSFEKALKTAQDLGYAEADPSFDIDGMDACHKLAILASICFDQKIDIDSIKVQGIRGLTRDDIISAREELNCAVKHVAVARSINNEGLELRISPCLVPLDHPLAQVDDVFNAVHVVGDAVGSVMFYGPGAGKGPTASAVMSDIIYVARNIAAGIAGKVPAVVYDVDHVENRPILADDKIKNRFFLKFMALDAPGVLAKVSGMLSEYGISISSVRQRERKKGTYVPMIFSTHKAFESDLAKALSSIEALSEVKGPALVMRLVSPGI